MKAKELKEGGKVFRINTWSGVSNISIFEIENKIEMQGYVAVECKMTHSSTGEIYNRELSTNVFTFEFEPENTEAIDMDLMPFSKEVLKKDEFYFTEKDFRAAVEAIYHPRLNSLKEKVEEIEQVINTVDKMLA